MKIIEFDNVSKKFFSNLLYDEVNLVINQEDKIAMLGANGSGKTTFVKMILEEISPDTGTIRKIPKLTISSLNQFEDMDFSSITVRDMLDLPFQEVIEAEKNMHLFEEKLAYDGNEATMNGYIKSLEVFNSLGGYSYLNYQSSFITVFGFTDMLEKPFAYLSGGEQQYLRLALAIFKPANLIILDEPLSYFDEKKRYWLIEYIQKSKSAFLVISHQIDFVKAFANVIFDVDDFKIKRYSGDYQSYLEQKEADQKRLIKINKVSDYHIKERYESLTKKYQWMKKSPDPHKHLVVIRRLEREIAKMEQNKVKFKERPSYDFKMVIQSPKEPEQKEILVELKNVTKRYADKTLFERLNLSVYTNDHILITGENGVGKPTLLNIISRSIQPDEGEVYEYNLKIAYVPQKVKFIKENITVEDYCKLQTGMWTDRLDYALSSLFPNSCDFRKQHLSMLSGGEKKRIQIMVSLFTNSNLVILDEPTTFMDEYTKNKLLEIINQSMVAVILVTHDVQVQNQFIGKKYELKNFQLCSLEK